MDGEKVIAGNAGFAVSALLALLMGLVAMNFMPESVAFGSGFYSVPGCGFLLSGIPGALAGWGILMLTAIMMVIIKRSFNFIPTLTKIHASLFLVIAGANPLLSGMTGISSLLALANVTSLFLLFSRYGKGNGRDVMFYIGMIFSAGSFLDYSFLPMIPAYALSALVLKIFGFRELLAVLLGIATPWWILAGFTFPEVPFPQLPDFTFSSTLLSSSSGIIQIVMTGICALAGIMFFLSNSISMLSAGTAVRDMNRALAIPGAMTLIMLLTGITGFAPYLASLCMFTAFEAGYFCATHHKTSASVWWLTLLTYLTLFIFIFYE